MPQMWATKARTARMERDQVVRTVTALLPELSALVLGYDTLPAQRFCVPIESKGIGVRSSVLTRGENPLTVRVHVPFPSSPSGSISVAADGLSIAVQGDTRGVVVRGTHTFAEGSSRWRIRAQCGVGIAMGIIDVTTGAEAFIRVPTLNDHWIYRVCQTTINNVPGAKTVSPDMDEKFLWSDHCSVDFRADLKLGAIFVVINDQLRPKSPLFFDLDLARFAPFCAASAPASGLIFIDSIEQ